MTNISQEAVFFRPFDVRLLPLTPLRAKKWEAFSSQGDFIFFPCDRAAGFLSGSGTCMALPWGHGPEVTAAGHCFRAKVPELSPTWEKTNIALAGARVRTTSPRFKALWHALVTFFFF